MQPQLAQVQWLGGAKEAFSPTGTVTLNQTPASVAVASTTGFPAAGTFQINQAGVVKLVTYTGTDGTHFTGSTIAAGSLSVTTAALIYGPQGTAITAPTFYLPVTTITPEDVRERIRDESFDGDANVLRGVYDGVIDATLTVEGPIYPDTIGHLLAASGMADVTSGSTIHTMKHPSDPTANQPPSYTWFYYDVYELRAMSGCVLDTLDLKFPAKGMSTFTATFKAFKSQAAAAATFSGSAVPPFMNWQAAASINSVAVDRTLSLEYNFKRSTDAIHTLNGVQTPARVFAGARDLSMKSQFLFSDNTELNHFLNNDQQPIVTTLTSPAGPTLVLTTTKTAWMKMPWPTPSGTYLAVSGDLDAIANTTDSGPWSAVLTNSVAAAY